MGWSLVFAAQALSWSLASAQFPPPLTGIQTANSQLYGAGVTLNYKQASAAISVAPS